MDFNDNKRKNETIKDKEENNKKLKTKISLAMDELDCITKHCLY